jgi:ubiquinone/menaquinone biosynthesis C-methylase UbiE
MLARARESAAEAGAGNVLFCQAAAESLPLADDSMDVALVNGIFNLNPARESIFRELGRVVRRNGVVYSAELILNEALPAEQQASEANWFA